MLRILALTLAFLAVGVWVASASPCVDVNAAFNPTTAQTGDQVTFSASLSNTGNEASLVTLAVTVAFNDHTFGPLQGKIYLEAGQEVSVEMPFPVRPVFPTGTLTLTLDASAGECTDAAVSTLSIESTTSPPEPSAAELEATATGILNAFGMGPTPARPLTWGMLKTLYRD